MLLIKESARLLSAKPLTLTRQPLLFIIRSNPNLVNYFNTKGYRINSCTNLSEYFNPLVSRRPVAAAHFSVSRYFQLANQSTQTNRSSTKQINLHDIGEGISEVVVKEWKVKVGDSVRQSDGICEVESDKAAVTVQSPFDGIIAKLYYDEGCIAKVGLPLVDISFDSNQSGQETGSNQDVQTAATDESSHLVNNMQESIPSTNDQSTQNALRLSLPSVRRLAKERNLDLSKVVPTGKKGQILKEDLLAYLKSEPQVVFAASTTLASPASQRTKSYENELDTNDRSLSKKSRQQQLETQVPLRGIQKAMFKSMTQSLKIPHFSYSDEIDMTRLVEASKRRRMDSFPKVLQSALGNSEKVNNFAFIIKMVSLALLEYPQLNASLDESGEQLIVKNYHNIGVAVDTPDGLVVPNVKNVQNLSIIEINLELQRLRSLGYSSKLSFNDLSGGTFTLSNIGAIGGIFGIPVLVSPEIVIGALGRTRKLPRLNSLSASGVEERHVMQIVWSADHRIVDGATLSRFSNLLKHYLEEPESGLLKLA